MESKTFRSATMAMALMSVILAGGCHCCGKRSRQKTMILSRPGARAMLAAARTNQINMFGDLPQADGSNYVGRASMSLTQHTFTEVGADFDPDLNAAGTRMVFSSTRHSILPDLYFKNIDGVAVTQLTSDPASDIQPSLSPDGNRVAFASNRSGNWDIWVVNMTGGPPVQITNDRSDDIHPSWSPDGRQVAFCSLPVTGGQWGLWIADVASGSTRASGPRSCWVGRSCSSSG